MDSKQPETVAVGSGRLVRRIKLPHGWEKCRTGIKGARKWRNMRTGCWVTERAGDPVLHCGIHAIPAKYARDLYTAQSAINEIEAATADFEKETGIVVNFYASSNVIGQPLGRTTNQHEQ